jgi:imidazolonepropionase
MNMASRLFELTAEEALAGVTRNAARALGEHAARGTLAVGQAADFVCWQIDSIAELSYWIGFQSPHRVVRAGKLVT